MPRCPSRAASCRTCRRVATGLEPAKLEALRAEADRHPDEDVWRNFRVHPDLVLAEGWRLTKTGRPRAEPEIRVDQVRDLISEIAGTPFEARRRVFVIDDAHTMNDSAQNALLKSLEEPPPRSHILLVTSAPLGLRQTIRSRCQLVRFGPLPRATIEAVLLERGGLTAGRGAAAGGAGGRQRRCGARVRVGAAPAHSRERARRFSSGWTGLDALGRMEAAEQMEQTEDAALLLTILRSLLRDVAALRAGGSAAELGNADVADAAGRARGAAARRACRGARRARGRGPLVAARRSRTAC